jgi:hypothetical protein
VGERTTPEAILRLELRELAVRLRDALQRDVWQLSTIVPVEGGFRFEEPWACVNCGERKPGHDDYCGIGQALAKAAEVLGE